MADVLISYKDATIAQMSASGTKTLLTADNYCENNIVVEYTRPTASDLVSGTLSITENGTGIDVTNYASVDVNVSGDAPTLQTKSVMPTETMQVITPDSGYDGLAEVDIDAISSDYVGSNITRRSSSDLTASGATVTAPAGYYESSATKTVASGTAGTPTATKGTVSNHSISVTPSVTNTTGYITGQTKTGTAVTVSANELVSGSQTITENGTVDVTNLASVVVNVSGGGGGSDPASSKQIYFIDYDGTIVKSYTKSEWQNVTSLPSNPSHSGLTAQGWNWTKAQIDEQLTAIPDGDVWVGQMYITDDGKTRVYIRLEKGRLHPYFGICPNGTVIVDWGDNSATATLTGTSLTTVKIADHEYASAGDYVITLTVSSGSFAFYGVQSTSHILKKGTATTAHINKVYTNAVQKIELGTGASIGNYAFNYCFSLASITIPDSVTDIGSCAFYYCYSLTSVTIPRGTTDISTSTFYYCYSIENIAIPSEVTNIRTNAFYYCYSLISITIPSGVTNIGANAFYCCYSLVNITIPNGVTKIMGSTFYYCCSLINITIPSGVTSIDNAAFTGCSSLANITIPNGVTSIGNYVFSNCSSLASITIPSGVTSIGMSAFQNCYSLISITIPSGVTSIEANAFQNCYSLANITIPSEVTSIGNYAFSSCHSLVSITIPDSVTSIGTYAFQNCNSLTSITISSEVTTIGSYMFYSCYSLASVTISSGVTSIGKSVFAACYGMAEYHFLPTAPPMLEATNAFNNIQSDCIIYVPSESLEAYQTATNWSTYASYMRGE